MRNLRKMEEVFVNGRSLVDILNNLEDVNLEGADLSGVDLSGVDLRGVDLRGANLRNADLEGAVLFDAKLQGADLENADLNGAGLEGANLFNANLFNANLGSVDLSHTCLEGADLENADLSGADLRYANLSYANLEDADLSEAILRGADLEGVNLRNADLSYADLENADLIDANLEGVIYNYRTTFYSLQCPEEGSFIGYNVADGKVIKLLIPEDAKRSSGTSRKCKCNKAKVLSITSVDGSISYEEVEGDYDEEHEEFEEVVYRVGEITEVEDYNEDRWNKYGNGIHFFMSRDEAVQYLDYRDNYRLFI